MRNATHKDRVLLLRRYLATEIAIRKLSPKTVADVYIPGIMSALTWHDSDVPMRAAWADRSVKDTIKGFKKIHASNNPEGSTIKIPWSVALANRSKQIIVSKEVDLVQLRGLTDTTLALAIMRIHLAMLFGIFFLLRKSEFLDERSAKAAAATASHDSPHTPSRQSKKDSPALRFHLIFLDRNGKTIPYKLIGKITASRLVFDVLRSKTDQFGKGRFNSHTRQDSGTCIVKLMESYISLTRDAYGAREMDPLFHVNGLTRLTPENVKQSMRAVAERLGLPADRISIHSLRYGGATMMGSAGFPEFLIAQYGGWVEGSESLKIYIRPTFSTIDRVSSHMANGGNADAEKELLMHIKAVHKIYRQDTD
jgi:hypothetical protein